MQTSAVTEQTETPIGLTNPELKRIQGYFRGEIKPDRFDGFGRSNDHSADYFNHAMHPETARTRACVSVEAVAFGEISHGLKKMIYVPCGISSGLRVHEALDRMNHNNAANPDYELHDSSYEAGRKVGSGAHGTIMAQNKDDTMRRGRLVARTHPDAMVILPPIREGGVRALHDHAFAGGQRYEEEDFMAFWYPAIDRCTGMMIDITKNGQLEWDQTVNDWNFSRNSIWEMMRGLLIQASEVPYRPNADMDVFDMEGRPVSMLARAFKMTEMLQYQLGKGFDTREAATALAQIFTLDDDIRACRIPHADRKLHPSLSHRPAEELQAMDALKEQFKPLLLAHCAQHLRLDDLPAEYAKAAVKKPRPLSAAQQDYFKKFADAVSARQLEILSVEPSQQLRNRLSQMELPPQRLYDSYERFFEKRAHAALFEDDLYSKLSHWERLALPFAIGATEVGLHPANQPMATAIFTDLKRGNAGFAQAQAAGVQSMNEFAGAAGRAIEATIAQNMLQAETLKAQLQSDTPGRVVVNTPSFLRIADAITHYRKIGEGGKKSQRFVAAEGPANTSPMMRLALQMKYLDRNVDRAVFQEGWQYSNDLVQLRVRARLLQAGLIERPNGVQSSLHVVNAEQPEKQETLLDDIKLLCAEVARNAEAGVRAPEQALALARLVALHELLVDPTLQRTEHKATRELVNMLQADDALTCYNRAEAEKVATEAKELLMSKALFVRSKEGDRPGDALLIPRERLYAAPDPTDDVDRAAAKIVQNRLMESYVRAQDVLIGEQSLTHERTRTNAAHITRDGVLR